MWHVSDDREVREEAEQSRDGSLMSWVTSLWAKLPQALALWEEAVQCILPGAGQGDKQEDGTIVMNTGRWLCPEETSDLLCQSDHCL